MPDIAPPTTLRPHREVLDQILDLMAEHELQKGSSPTLLTLPMLEAYALCKCTRNDASEEFLINVFRNGVHAFEKEGMKLYGMTVTLTKRHGELKVE